MLPTTYLITGASRGIGLAMASQLLAASPANRIVAGVRRPAAAVHLHALKDKFGERLELLEMDVSSVASIQRAAGVAAGLPILANGLDVLHNNAGVFAGTYGGPLEPNVLDTLQANLQTNLIGPVATVQAFLPLLRQGRKKTIWFTSAVAASQGGWPGEKPVCATYAVSKAGLNMWSLKLARALEPEGFTVLAFHPGLVKTDMTVSAVREGAAVHGMTAEESAGALLEMLATKGPADSFKFWDVTGEEIPF